ncbi:ABC transporter substrate-binding protein [Desulfovibrio sp. JC022]|uniref:substrate-binding periplasmic protein n=1 Tax=Desulfovibrio sp. JC022 TaxID=2593642 RepID=UPI0013D44B8F|nr:transporter substrate-binding domain-containing protein [Desulfovibrio sp. JC022]NDV24402.1 transporter substrate-binding domain-containing protein [Desulfovibrio sp. JC022]
MLLRKVLWKFLYLALILLFLCEPVCAGEEKVLLSTGEWAPYTSEYVQGGGLCSEIVGAAFAAVDMNTELKFYPWKRAILSFQRGEVEGSFPWVRRNETAAYALFSSPLHSQKYSFFYYKEKFPDGISYKNLDELMKYRIGICRGYFYGSQLTEMGLNTQLINNSSNGIMMLMRGYIDLMTEDSVVGNYLISVLMPGREHEFGENQAPLKSEPVYLLVSKKNPDGKALIERFDSGLAKIKANGIYDEILKKHALD